MKLLIRVDMNNFIATGHVMRCLAIADAAHEQNICVYFVGSDECGRKVVEERGYTYFSLGTLWNKMEEELPAFTQVIHQLQPEYVLVDSYYVTVEYMRCLRKLCKVAYIDDLGEEVYPCDTLICYANYYKKFSYERKYAGNTQLLLGCEYVPLRKEFSSINARIIKPKVEKVLVLSGGTDPFHFLKQFLMNIECNCEVWDGISISVICGLYNSDYSYLLERYADNSQIEILCNIQNVHEYMGQADVAVSAGGTSLYELSACGTPTVCYAFADNQLDNVRSFGESGAMIYGGDLRINGTVLNIISMTEELLMNFSKRKEMSEKLKQLVDGSGATQVVEKLFVGKLNP